MADAHENVEAIGDNNMVNSGNSRDCHNMTDCQNWKNSGHIGVDLQVEVFDTQALVGGMAGSFEEFHKFHHKHTDSSRDDLEKQHMHALQIEGGKAHAELQRTVVRAEADKAIANGNNQSQHQTVQLQTSTQVEIATMDVEKEKFKIERSSDDQHSLLRMQHEHLERMADKEVAKMQMQHQHEKEMYDKASIVGIAGRLHEVCASFGSAIFAIFVYVCAGLLTCFRLMTKKPRQDLDVSDAGVSDSYPAEDAGLSGKVTGLLIHGP